jgi:hypothetical protein
MQLSTHTPPPAAPGTIRDRFRAFAGGAVVLVAILGLYLSVARYAPVTTGTAQGGAPAIQLLPSSLGSLDRAWALTGAEALREVRGLHVGDFRMIQAEVAGYGDGATVWVATPARPDAADRYVTRMAEAITDGETPFTAPTLMPSTPGVWQTQGSGQQHVFFAADGAIWWLAADPADADDALTALLQEVRP